MDTHFSRAMILFDQGRHELAEKELRQCLAADPDNAMAHALLAHCLAKIKQYTEATFEARRAIELGPDGAFNHYTLASVLHDRDHLEEAAESIAEAIRLNPEDPDFYWLLGAIRYDQRDWTAALEGAEEGLRFDPEHVNCNNLRAIALVKLGRKAEAGITIEAALARDPDNAYTHANQGWTLLEKGDPQKAMEHFREALRINPELEWARQGIVEALKARHLIYYYMLRYFLWMQKLSQKGQWAIVIGGVVGVNVLTRLAESHPVLQPAVWPIQIAYMAFAILTWTADPLFNLVLRTNRFGRLALSRQQIVASNWIGAAVAVALGAVGVFLWTWDRGALWTAIGAGIFMMPLSAVFKIAEGVPRVLMAVYTALLGQVGILALTLYVLDIRVYVLPTLLYFLAAIASTWVANILLTIRTRR